MEIGLWFGLGNNGYFESTAPGPMVVSGNIYGGSIVIWFGNNGDIDCNGWVEK